MARGLTACALAAMVLASGAQAQLSAPLITSPPSATPDSATRAESPSPAAGPCCLVVAGTPVEIELTERVSSRSIKGGARFGIRLAHDLQLNGVVLMNAGAPGLGEVIDAAPGGIAGRPGKLVLAARFVESGPIHLPLRSFKLAGSGHDESKTAMALTMTPYVGLLALGIQGGNIDFPAGTRAVAKVAADTFIASSPGGQVPQASEKTP